MVQVDHRPAMRGTVGRRAPVDQHSVLTPWPEHVDAPTATSRARRTHRYILLMAGCLALFVLAWAVVRNYSVPGAVVMALVAMVIPPVAVVVANWGADVEHAEDHLKRAEVGFEDRIRRAEAQLKRAEEHIGDRVEGHLKH